MDSKQTNHKADEADKPNIIETICLFYQRKSGLLPGGNQTTTWKQTKMYIVLSKSKKKNIFKKLIGIENGNNNILINRVSHET